MTDVGQRRRSHWFRRLLVGLVIVAIGATAGWAASVVFAPPRDVLDETPFTFVELVDGEVGSSITLNTVAEWDAVPVGTNQAAGTVTAVHVQGGAEVSAGSVLYEVNLRPVVVAAGPTPAFRSMSRGTVGADVQQLQAMLADLGLYSGEQDGEFGWNTEVAVRDWQDSLGVDDDGVVQAGDVLFVPSLPGRIAMDSEVVFRGASLGGGEAVVSGLATEPSFTIPATAAQAASMPVGTLVQIQANDAVWSAEVAGQRSSEDGADQVDVVLQGLGGASICGAECRLIPVTGQSLLVSEIITQETVAGVVVPAAALLSSPGGGVSVIDADGVAHDVSVVASARGMSVVLGAEEGMHVRIPATAGATQ